MRLLTYLSLFVAVASASWMLSSDLHPYITTKNIPIEQSQKVVQKKKQERRSIGDSFSSFLMIDTITYVTPNEAADTLAITLPNCIDDYSFRSDRVAGSVLYKDTEDEPRNNVTTICSPSKARRLLVTFTTFDLSEGDTLFVYDGADTLAPLIDKASGIGVSKINGGWLNSNCDPSINPSNCLTFQFKTNGDGRTGEGWESWVTCIDEATASFNKSTDIVAQADCTTLIGNVDIKIPQVTFGDAGICTISNDSVIVEYALNGLDEVACNFRDTLRADSVLNVSLPYGIYDIKFKLLKDTTITSGCILSITAGSFVCNDTVSAAIGQGCKSFLRPDDLLESFGTCAPFDDDTIKQFFVIHVETDTGRVSGTSTNPPLLSAKEGGNIVCNGIYDVFITRVIELKNLTCGIGGSDPIQYRDSCQVDVRFIDGIRPVFVDILGDTLTKIDTFVGCQDIQIKPEFLDKPKVFDNCELEYFLEVQVPDIELEACDTNKYFHVKWSVADKCGNTAEAIQKILIQRPTAENLHAPKDTMIACGMPASPSITGWPHLDTNDDGMADLELITDGGSTCFLDVSFKDDTIPNCGESIKIIRYWSLRNFCDNEQAVTPADTQVIEIIDTIAPIMFKPAPGVVGSYENPYTFSTSPRSCQGIPGEIPRPGGIDSCDLDFQTQIIELVYPNNQREVFPDLDEPLPIGLYSAGFVHVDACGNRSDTCYIYFEIQDQQAPTPICTDELRVSVTSGDFPIRPEDINNGSTDNCGIDRMYIRRSICGNPDVLDPTTNNEILTDYGGRVPANGWAEYIEVGCCDIYEPVRVQLLVIDEVGNYNQCWLNIFPEDHINPICAALPDTVVVCDELELEQFEFLSSHYGSTDSNHNNLPDDTEWTPIPEDQLVPFNNAFGHPSCIDNISCNTITIEQEYQVIKGVCGIQTILRRYRAIDLIGDGNTSKWLVQNITISYRPSWAITFPSDTTFQCGSVIPEFPIMINSQSCDVLKWEFTDEIFAGSGGGCYKVLRRWEVINSCILDNTPTIIALPRDPNINGEVTHNSKRTFYAKDLVDGHYLGDYGYFTYTQVLKVTDSEVPIITMSVENDCVVGDDNCRATKVFTITAEDCTFSNDIVLKYELYEGNTLVHVGEGASVEYPVSIYEPYRLKVEAYDNCGNSTEQERLFSFQDCDPPIALCNGGNLNIDINTDLRAVIPAVWLNNRSSDNCDSDLEYKIWHKTVSEIPPASPATISLLPSSITLGCGDIGQSAVILFVLDDNENFSSCNTNITIQDVSRACPLQENAVITGNITTIDGESVEGVEVQLRTGIGDLLEGGNLSENARKMTDVDGSFAFRTAPGQDLTVIPKKNIAAKNGVSTFDIVLIQKHILGIDLLDSPYKHIAADVNKSGTITAFDIVQIRQLVLEIIPEFPNNESWRFINASQLMNFNTPLSEIQETYQIPDVQGTIHTDFVAVKIGDVSSNAQTTALLSATPRSNHPALQMTIADQLLKAGERYEIQLELADQDYQGFQFTLDHPNLSLLEWRSNKLQPAHFHHRSTKQGTTNVSWNESLFQAGEKESTTQLTLVVEAQQQGLLSDLLSLSTTSLQAEAYTKTNKVTAIELVFKSPSKQRTFEVYQNKPNPFTNTTTIEFYTPVASPVSLKVMDVTGMIVHQQTGDYTKGMHQLILTSTQLPANGLFYYELATATGKATKTMLLVH